MAITLLYQLGEGAAEETLKPGSGALGQLATGETKSPHPKLNKILHQYDVLVCRSVQECSVHENGRTHQPLQATSTYTAYIVEVWVPPCLQVEVAQCHVYF